MSADTHTLTGAYAADALSSEERREFEQHLLACAACRQEVAELQATAAQLATLAAEPPPTSLRAAVLAQIDTVRQEPPARDVALIDRARPRWYQRAAAPAAAALVIAVLGLTAIVATLNQRIGELEQQTTRVADVMAAPDAVTLDMPGPEGTSARVVVSPSRGEGVLLASGMPAAPGTDVYELWLIDAAGPTPAGLLDVDESGRITHVMTGDMTDVAAIAVTVEPAGGSPQPTTDPIMVAEL